MAVHGSNLLFYFICHSLGFIVSTFPATCALVLARSTVSRLTAATALQSNKTLLTLRSIGNDCGIVALEASTATLNLLLHCHTVYWLRTCVCQFIGDG